MGKPTIVGTRITVESILERLAAGESIAEVVASHPQLTEESVRDRELAPTSLWTSRRRTSMQRSCAGSARTVTRST
jgi:hypothetical protein